MNARNEKRVKKSLLAYSDGDSSDLFGVISNISKNGMFIESSNVFEPNSELTFMLAIYNETYYLRGEVRWAKDPGDQFPEGVPTGMGVRLIEAPVEYLNYVEYVKCQDRNSTLV